jgi:hypothetical protein
VVNQYPVNLTRLDEIHLYFAPQVVHYLSKHQIAVNIPQIIINDVVPIHRPKDARLGVKAQPEAVDACNVRYKVIPNPCSYETAPCAVQV